MGVRQQKWRPWESDQVEWGREAFVNIDFWSKKKRKKKKKKRRKKQLAERVVEKEWVVGDKVNSAHNPVVEHCVYTEEVAGLIDVVIGPKTF